MFEKHEIESIFTALDKGVDIDTYKQAIIDNCSGNFSFGEHRAVNISDEMREKLRFEQTALTLSYAPQYETVLLKDFVNKDDRNFEYNYALGLSNFIFFHNHNANPQYFIETIQTAMNYMNIQNFDELSEKLRDGGISDELVNRLATQMGDYSISQSQNENAPTIDETTIATMCLNSLKATDEECKELLKTLRKSIDPKFIIDELFHQQLLTADDYEIIRSNIDKIGDENKINDMKLTLVPFAGMALGTADNDFFRLVKDEQKGWCVVGDISKNKEKKIDLVELIDIFNSSRTKENEKKTFRQAMTDFLIQTEKSPFEILREAYTTTKYDKTNLELVNGGKAKGGNVGSNDEEQENIKHFEPITQEQHDLFDDIVAHIRFANPRFLTCLWRPEQEKQGMKNLQDIAKMLPKNSKVEKDFRSFIRSQQSQIARKSLYVFDSRHHETAYEMKRRYRKAFASGQFARFEVVKDKRLEQYEKDMENLKEFRKKMEVQSDKIMTDIKKGIKKGSIFAKDKAIEAAIATRDKAIKTAKQVKTAVKEKAEKVFEKHDRYKQKSGDNGMKI